MNRSDRSIMRLVIKSVGFVLLWILLAYLLTGCAFYTYSRHDVGTLHVEAPRDAVREIHEAPRVVYPKFRKNGFWIYWRSNE